MTVNLDYKNLSRYVSSYLGSLQAYSVDIDGQECKYIEEGEGETIVFIHGIGGSKVLWRSFRELPRWLALFLEKI